jgi:hypothetical protein
MIEPGNESGHLEIRRPQVLDDPICILQLGSVAIFELSHERARFQGYADQVLPKFVMQLSRELAGRNFVGRFLPASRAKFHTSRVRSEEACYAEISLLLRGGSVSSLISQFARRRLSIAAPKIRSQGSLEARIRAGCGLLPLDLQWPLPTGNRIERRNRQRRDADIR